MPYDSMMYEMMMGGGPQSAGNTMIRGGPAMPPSVAPPPSPPAYTPPPNGMPPGYLGPPSNAGGGPTMPMTGGPTTAMLLGSGPGYLGPPSQVGGSPQQPPSPPSPYQPPSSGHPSPPPSGPVPGYPNMGGTAGNGTQYNGAGYGPQGQPYFTQSGPSQWANMPGMNPNGEPQSYSAAGGPGPAELRNGPSPLGGGPSSPSSPMAPPLPPGLPPSPPAFSPPAESGASRGLPQQQGSPSQGSGATIGPPPSMPGMGPSQTGTAPGGALGMKPNTSVPGSGGGSSQSAGGGMASPPTTLTSIEPLKTFKSEEEMNNFLSQYLMNPGSAANGSQGGYLVNGQRLTSTEAMIALGLSYGFGESFSPETVNHLRETGGLSPLYGIGNQPLIDPATGAPYSRTGGADPGGEPASRSGMKHSRAPNNTGGSLAPANGGDPTNTLIRGGSAQNPSTIDPSVGGALGQTAAAGGAQATGVPSMGTLGWPNMQPLYPAGAGTGTPGMIDQSQLAHPSNPAYQQYMTRAQMGYPDYEYDVNDPAAKASHDAYMYGPMYGMIDQLNSPPANPVREFEDFWNGNAEITLDDFTGLGTATAPPVAPPPGGEGPNPSNDYDQYLASLMGYGYDPYAPGAEEPFDFGNLPQDPNQYLTEYGAGNTVNFNGTTYIVNPDGTLRYYNPGQLLNQPYRGSGQGYYPFGGFGNLGNPFQNTVPPGGLIGGGLPLAGSGGGFPGGVGGVPGAGQVPGTPGLPPGNGGPDVNAAVQEYQRAQDEARQANESRYNDILEQSFARQGLGDNLDDQLSSVLRGYAGRENIGSEMADKLGDVNSGYAQREGFADLLNQNYGNVLDSAASRQEGIMGLLAGLGDQQRRDIDEQYDRNQANATQSLLSRRLGNTTITDSVSRGIESDRERAHGRLGEQLRREQADYGTRLSGDTLGIMERAGTAVPYFGADLMGQTLGARGQSARDVAQFQGALTGDTLASGERSANNLANFRARLWQDTINSMEGRTDSYPDLSQLLQLIQAYGRAGGTSYIPAA